VAVVVLPSLGREVGSEAGRHGPLSTPLGPAGPAVPPPPPAPCLAMRVTSSLCFRARDAALLPGDAAPWPAGVGRASSARGSGDVRWLLLRRLSTARRAEEVVVVSGVGAAGVGAAGSAVAAAVTAVVDSHSIAACFTWLRRSARGAPAWSGPAPLAIRASSTLVAAETRRSCESDALRLSAAVAEEPGGWRACVRVTEAGRGEAAPARTECGGVKELERAADGVKEKPPRAAMFSARAQSTQLLRLGPPPMSMSGQLGLDGARTSAAGATTALPAALAAAAALAASSTLRFSAAALTACSCTRLSAAALAASSTLREGRAR